MKLRSRECIMINVMIKNLPNLLSLGRMLVSIVMIYTKPYSVWFYLSYVFCGASDILDGFVARRAHCESQKGAALDSAADTIFVICIVAFLYRSIEPPIWSIIWVSAILAIKLTTLCIGYGKYKTLPFLHTYANKLSGLALYISPLIFSIIGGYTTIAILCALTSFSATEELILTIISKTFNANIHSIFYNS